MSNSISKLAFFVAALLLAYLLYPTLKDIALICWNNDDYSHGLILPLISAYLIWTDRKRIFNYWRNIPAPGVSIVSLLLFLCGALLLVTGGLTNILFFSWAAVFPLVLGFIGLSVGLRATKPLIAPILLLFMAKPLPDSLVPILFFPLQVFAAKVGAKVLEFLEVPVYLVGNIIEIPGMRLMVEEACSGIRSLMALLTVACIVMLIVPLSGISRIFIFFLSVFTAILLNVLRVTMTGVLAHFYDPQSATGFFHEFSGLVVFGVGLLVVYSVANLLAKKEAASASLESRPYLPALSKAGVVLSLVLILAGFAVKETATKHVAVAPELALNLKEFPFTLGEFTGKDGERMELTSSEKLKLDSYVRRFYKSPEDPVAFLYIGYWGHQSGDHQAAKHSPMMCLPANGWKVSKLAPVSLHLPTDKVVQVNRVVGQFDQHFTLVYYFFFNGDQFYIREWEALLRISSNALFGKRTDGGIVEISVELTPDEAATLIKGGDLKKGRKFLERVVIQISSLLR